MPVVWDAQQFEAQLGDLRRLCAQAGRADIEVTAGLWEIDEPLMARCAELGIDRFMVIAPTQTPAALHCFLDQYLEVADRIIR